MNLNPPKYRLRLFLSVDLVGSTAFKSRAGNSNLKWIKAFQKFYAEFPDHLTKNFKETAGGIDEIAGSEISYEPKVWKTIGDEILFVTRVNSVTHLGACITAFSKTLIDFGRVISSFGLDTKGNAWVAAFPTPNMSIKLAQSGSDPLTGDASLPSEERELLVDATPSQYDFLGKGIDGGFRISRNSSIDDLTLSPALAYLLCKAKRMTDVTKFDARFSFHEPQVFKGVVNGARYPVVSLSTSRDVNADKMRQLEATLLQKPAEARTDELLDYLERFIAQNDIEAPVLKLTDHSPDPKPPPHYEAYVEEWKRDFDDLISTQKLEEKSANAGRDEAADGSADNSNSDGGAPNGSQHWSGMMDEAKRALEAAMRIRNDYSEEIHRILGTNASGKQN
ncbi:hypothetical protein [Gemmobacter sp. 24YEA27]|uniref:hypothetical protein n=1 Tax=Gemmobacter sp. 24YEA27 TaxID=3040672 RepID=UPI0024B3797C|nr:hypothetical protein [Gemmobacter sp. 24YEA27]